MGTILKNGIAYGASNQPTAAAVPYSNTSSGLTATNVQSAIDEASRVKMYSDVTQLGLTSGSATLVAAIAAMPNGSVLFCNASQFASSELPDIYGVIELIKITTSRSALHFYAKYGDSQDYRMSFESNGTPTGTWLRNDQYGAGEKATVKNGYIPSVPLNGGKRISFGFALPKVRGDTTPTISVCKLNLRGLTTGYVAYQGGAYVSGGYNFKSVATLASTSGDNNVMIQLNFSAAQVGASELVGVEIDDIQITF